MANRKFTYRYAWNPDFYAWTQQQAAALRARDWAAVDVEHVAEEIEDLWKSDCHYLAMLVLAFLELSYRPCAREEGRYAWQSAVIDHYRAMLERGEADDCGCGPCWTPGYRRSTPGPAGRS